MLYFIKGLSCELDADLMGLCFCAPSDTSDCSLFVHRSAVSVPVTPALEEEPAASVKNCSGETLRSNVTVGLPCHVLMRRRDRCDGVMKNKADLTDLEQSPDLSGPRSESGPEFRCSLGLRSNCRRFYCGILSAPSILGGCSSNETQMF